MAWTAALSHPEWGHWLLEVAGTNRVRPGVKLDPFGSSWRVLSRQARRWLPQIDAGTPIFGSERRIEQTLIDLRAADLVTPGAYSLTPLGQAVLARWTSLPDEWEYELPLAIALLQEALILKAPGYRDMLGFWWDVRRRFGDENALLKDREAVLLVQYLNQTAAGFNPWISLREAPGPILLPVPWKELRRAVSKPTRATNEAIGRIQARLDPGRRWAARVVFCRAMTLLFLRKEQPAAVRTVLEHLELPFRTER